MALYLTKLVNGQVQKLRVSPTKALYRGYWAVIVGGFAGTSVTCNGVTKFIGSSERVAFNIITPGTYTFTATRQGTTLTKEVVLNNDTPEYIINLSMFIGMQHLEYIESTGTQWIDTGVVYSSANHKSVVKFSHVSSGSDNAPWWVWGSDSVLTTNGSRSGAVALKSDNNTLGIGVGEITGGSSPYTIPNPTVPITVDIETKDNNTFSVSVNGLSIYDNVSFNGSCYGTSSEALFGINVNGTIQQKTSTKIYAAQFYDNGILVRDFIPVKDDTGRGALYDKVTQQIFYNSGTGDFICGPNKPYTRIQYLESTGTQWIDSGVTLSNKLAVETVFQTTSVDGQTLFGDSTYYNNNQRFYLDIKNNNFRLARGNAYVEFTSADTNKHTLRFASDTTTVMWDGNPITVVGSFSGTSTDSTVKIFASSPINPDQLGHVKYYSFKMYKNDELVRDFVPVLDYDGVPCMYDKVEGKLYYNQGTGEFVAGPEYVELEYIEGLNNEQYINTGIVPTSDMEIYLKMCTATYNSSDPSASVGCRSASTWVDDGFCVFYGTSTNTRIDMSWLGSNPTITRWKLNASYAAGDIFEISVKNSLAEIVKNGTSIGTHQFVPDATCDRPIYINGLNNAGSIFTQKNIRMRQYRFTIKGVCDLIPVRMGTEVGMYDTVTDTFFANAGEGQFIAGPEKQ